MLLFLPWACVNAVYCKSGWLGAAWEIWGHLLDWGSSLRSSRILMPNLGQLLDKPSPAAGEAHFGCGYSHCFNSGWLWRRGWSHPCCPWFCECCVYWGGAGKGSALQPVHISIFLMGIHALPYWFPDLGTWILDRRNTISPWSVAVSITLLLNQQILQIFSLSQPCFCLLRTELPHFQLGITS